MNSYSEIARIKKQTPMFFREFGSYQGEWLLVSHDANNVYIYKDSYGSCSGCDSLQAEEPNTPVEERRFANNYRPEVTIPKHQFLDLSEKHDLKSILPINIDYDITDDELNEVVSIIENTAICLWGIAKPENIVKIENAEILREVLDSYGIKKFVKDSGMEVINEDAENKLYQLDSRKFLLLKDSSTNRKYLVEVDGKCDSVRKGIAWSFNIPDDYIFEQES